MRIIVWGINYTPEMTGIAPYNTAMCEFLSSKGHEVEMVTSFAYYPDWKKRDADAGRMFRTDRMGGVVVRRCWLHVPRKVTALQRMVHEASFVATSFLRVCTLRRADVCVAVSPPLLLGVAAWLAGLLKGTPFVFHIQDLQPDAAVGLGMLKNRRLVRALYAIEHFVYDRAAGISAISEGILRMLRGKGVPPEKLFWFPNGVKLLSPVPAPEKGRFRAAHGMSDEDFLAVYAGNLGVKQGLKVLIDAARELARGGGGASERRIHMVIAGDGALRGDLEEAVRSDDLGNLSLLPIQPEGNYREMMTDADCCLITQQCGTGAFFLPSKVLGALAHGKPVLSAADESSDLAVMVESGGFGSNVPPGAHERLAATLREWSGAPDRLKEMSARATACARSFEMNEVMAGFEQRLRGMLESWEASGITGSADSQDASGP